MRIIYKRATGDVIGIIGDRITSFIPPSAVGDDTTYVDIDYSQDTLDKKHPLATYLEENRDNLLKKIISIDENNQVSFTDKPEKKEIRTVLIDVDAPTLHKDCEIYSKKGVEMGATVGIEEVGDVIQATINAEGESVGMIRLEKRGRCTYLYTEGRVYKREYFPHYVGFMELIKYLFGKARFIDMGGFVKNDEDLNRFKRKWGREDFSTVA